MSPKVRLRERAVLHVLPVPRPWPASSSNRERTHTRGPDLATSRKKGEGKATSHVVIAIESNLMMEETVLGALKTQTSTL